MILNKRLCLLSTLLLFGTSWGIAYSACSEVDCGVVQWTADGQLTSGWHYDPRKAWTGWDTFNAGGFQTTFTEILKYSAKNVSSMCSTVGSGIENEAQGGENTTLDVTYNDFINCSGGT